jgi:hypothetical protein
MSLIDSDPHLDKKINNTIMSTDRSFGLVLTIFFMILAFIQFWGGSSFYLIWIIISFFFATLSIIFPRVLRPLNFLWFKFGLTLHYIISPVTLSIMFYLVFTPFAVILRLINKRPLHLKFDAKIKTYWIIRVPSGPAVDSFKNQF